MFEVHVCITQQLQQLPQEHLLVDIDLFCYFSEFRPSKCLEFLACCAFEAEDLLADLQNVVQIKALLPRDLLPQPLLDCDSFFFYQ